MTFKTFSPKIYKTMNKEIGSLSEKVSEETKNIQLNDSGDKIVKVEINKREKGLNIKSFTELAEEGENLPEIRKLWGNFVLEGHTVLFPAERGVGKSFLCMQLAIAISEGFHEFLGEKIEIQGNTLYINMEMGDLLMKKRLNKLYKKVELSEQNTFNAYCLTDRRNITDIEEEIVNIIQKERPVLVVIDNLRTAFNDKDNEKNKDMTKVIRYLNELRDACGFALILVHHTKKNTSMMMTHSDLQSGAGAISDLVDADFFLRKSQSDPASRILIRTKSRSCEEENSCKLLKLNPETLWFEVEVEDVNESDHIFNSDSPQAEKVELKKEAIRMYREGKTMAQIGEEMDVNKSTVSRWLKDVFISVKEAKRQDVES